MNEPQDKCPLTSAELRVLRFMADGASAKEAAAQIGRSFNGVNARTKIMRRTIGAKNSAHMVAIAFRKGWIE